MDVKCLPRYNSSYTHEICDDTTSTVITTSTLLFHLT